MYSLKDVLLKRFGTLQVLPQVDSPLHKLKWVVKTLGLEDVIEVTPKSLPEVLDTLLILVQSSEGAKIRDREFMYFYSLDPLVLFLMLTDASPVGVDLEESKCRYLLHLTSLSHEEWVESTVIELETLCHLLNFPNLM